MVWRRRAGPQPADYADAVAAALAAKRPKTRYRVGVDSRLSALARRVLPDRMMDTLVAVELRGGEAAPGGGLAGKRLIVPGDRW